MNLVTLKGPVRVIQHADLGLSTNRDRHVLSGAAVPPHPTQAEAEKALQEVIRMYTDRTWPGGCVTGQWLVHWTDSNEWSGVFESYYSFS